MQQMHPGRARQQHQRLRRHRQHQAEADIGQEALIALRRMGEDMLEGEAGQVEGDEDAQDADDGLHHPG